MQLDHIMKVTPEKRKRSPTKKTYQQTTVADTMEIDQDNLTRDSTEKNTKSPTNTRQNMKQPTTNIKLFPKYTPSQQTVNNNKLMEENDNEVMVIPKLAKGHSDITTKEDDWYTIEKGKAVKNKNETKK